MDVKALAKSKRAHTQHHSKKPLGNRPNQKLKAPLEGNSQPGIAKNPSGRPVGEKIHRSRGGAPALPSNLDRYDEEFDSGSEDPSGDSASRYSDVILPKSKGADYSHLIAEAQSQSHSNTYLDGFPSLDDVLPGEFNQGLGSMLAVRGEGILSWIGEDNFVVEDKTTASHEASFLSLNLHALAEALAKVDLPKRIFIESDLLPPELQCAQEGSAITSTQESEELQSRYDSEVDQRMLEQLSIDDSSEKVKIADQYFEVTSSGSSRGGHAVPTLLSESSVPMNIVDIDPGPIGSSDQGTAVEADELIDHFVVNPTKKSSMSQTKDAERELDILLDSFSESKILDSSGIRSNTSVSSQISRPEPDSSKTTTITADLDDALDNLLQETSTVMTHRQPQEEKFVLNVMKPSSSDSGTKPKLLDDFDSWLDTI